MKLYTIIAGVNGAGKSSLTGALRSERTDLGVIIDVDKITAELKSPITGGKTAIVRMDEAIRRGISFTQETTLSGKRTEKTIRKARDRGYTIRLYYVGLDTAEESIGRIQNRVAKGGHHIPKTDVLRRFKHRFSDLIRVLPYCDEAVFFDNENGFAEVAEYRNGQLMPKGKKPPQWLRMLIQEMGNAWPPPETSPEPPGTP